MPYRQSPEELELVRCTRRQLSLSKIGFGNFPFAEKVAPLLRTAAAFLLVVPHTDLILLTALKTPQDASHYHPAVMMELVRSVAVYPIDHLDPLHVVHLAVVTVVVVAVVVVMLGWCIV